MVEATDRIDRYCDGIECACGGYAPRVKSTEQECKDYGCGRDSVDYSCCARAFVCKICKLRIVGKAAAPEME